MEKDRVAGISSDHIHPDELEGFLSMGCKVPFGMFGDTCPFIHDNIDTLYNVTVMAIDDLPTVCTCGAALTYADEVCFVEVGDLCDSSGAVVKESEMTYEQRIIVGPKPPSGGAHDE